MTWTSAHMGAWMVSGDDTRLVLAATRIGDQFGRYWSTPLTVNQSHGSSDPDAGITASWIPCISSESSPAACSSRSPPGMSS